VSKCNTGSLPLRGNPASKNNKNGKIEMNVMHFYHQVSSQSVIFKLQCKS